MTGRSMVLSPTRGCDGGDRITGGGDLRLTPLEQSRTVYCEQDHYGPVYGGRVEAGFKGIQAVVGSRLTEFLGDADDGLGD